VLSVKLGNVVVLVVPLPSDRAAVKSTPTSATSNNRCCAASGRPRNEDKSNGIIQ